jgi:hypothetical protein
MLQGKGEGFMPSNYDMEFLIQYYELLGFIHRQLQPCFYLEVGVRNGDSISRANISTTCIGIDPAFEITAPLSPYTKLYRCTSEEFFRTDKLNDLLAGNLIDLAFIDGMHLFEFTLRDFINIEKYCDRNSVIILHDTLPLDELTSARERTTQVWSGDVWKLLPILERFRPDLLFQTIDVKPTGLTVVSNLDSHSRVLETNYERICREYIDLPYTDGEAFRQRILQLPYSKTEVRTLFAELARMGFFAFSGQSCKSQATSDSVNEQQLDSPLFSQSVTPIIVDSISRRRAVRCLAVLLCYNDADILSDVITYLLNQNHDLIAWDHSSNDDTAAVLDQFTGNLVERRLIPRDFDFYYLYQAMSKNLLDNYIDKYDWISWPDQDEILEGPDRNKSYYDYLQEIFYSQYDWIYFNNFNYWFTSQDPITECSPIRRIKHYSLFPDCAPRIRSWRATSTNIRIFNHNPPIGIQYPVPFNLRHYPMRSLNQARKRLFQDRANLQKGQQNFHYENMAAKPFYHLILSPEQLHFDDDVSDFNPEIKFNWRTIYGYGPLQ